MDEDRKNTDGEGDFIMKFTSGRLSLYFTDVMYPITVDNLRFVSGIDLYLYFKAKFFKVDTLAKYLFLGNEGGRLYWGEYYRAIEYLEELNTKEWEAARESYLIQTLLWKVESDDIFVGVLLETGNEDIVSVGANLVLDNGFDPYKRIKVGEGLNLLGKSLVKVRKVIRDENKTIKEA